MSKHNFHATIPSAWSLSGTCEAVYYVLQEASSCTYGFQVEDARHWEGAPRCSEPSVPEVEVDPVEGVGRQFCILEWVCRVIWRPVRKVHM